MPLVFPVPQLTTIASHGAAFFFGSIYVGSVYISRNARLSFESKAKPNRHGLPRERLANERWRDDSDVIKARLVAVLLATLACCLAISGLFWTLVGDKNDRSKLTCELIVTRLGFGTPTGLASVLPHLVTPILFSGPLYVLYLDSALPLQKYWSFEVHVVAKFLSWQGLRNYVVGPVTEEIVFRACVLSVYHLSGATVNQMVFVSPLVFGLAHVHHAWDTFNRYGRNTPAAAKAILSSMFLFAYTTIFGFHAAYLFIRTSSIFPSISSHIFCNVMGLPEVFSELKRYPDRKLLILMAYGIGVIGFWLTLQPLTWTDSRFYWQNRHGTDWSVY